jgi:23S rRNA (adenine2030-N6)-methyltransferase
MPECPAQCGECALAAGCPCATDGIAAAGKPARTSASATMKAVAFARHDRAMRRGRSPKLVQSAFTVRDGTHRLQQTQKAAIAQRDPRPAENRRRRARDARTMNYRHAFHAGNFADVFKHAILIGLLESLKRKQGALCYFDTHAGRGRYDLRSEEAARTREFAGGVQRLFSSTRLPTVLHVYVNLVRALNAGQGGELAVYPGSPLLASLVLREQDRAILCELEESEADLLKALFRGDARFAVHQRDGYEALKALTPPKQKRGLVLIDPPFEAQAGEFLHVESALAASLARWPNATYAVWYPIKLRQHIVPFHRWLAEKSAAADVLVAELLLHPDNSALRLNGCGMAILNPPWKLDREIEDMLPVLRALLAQSRYGDQRVEWLKRS